MAGGSYGSRAAISHAEERVIRRHHIYLAAAAVLVLLIVILPATAVLSGRWQEPSPLAISRLAVVTGVNAPATLLIEGDGFNQRLDALLIPAPSLDSDDTSTLVPSTALYRIKCDGQLGVAVARGRRLVTLDVRAGRAPRILGSVKLKESLDLTAVAIASLVQVGKQAVVGLTASEGLVLVDLADPAAPRKVGYLRLPGTVNEMLAVNGRIYAAAGKSGLLQVTINGNQLQAEQVPGTVDPWRLAVDGNRLAVINPRNDLTLYELDGAALPRLVGHERLPQAIRGVSLAAGALHLCLADGTLREYAVDHWPRLDLRGQLQLPGRPLRLLRSDNPPLLFCSLVGAGVCMIDVSRAGVPAIAGWLPTTTPITDLSVISGRLLTAGRDGLQVHHVEKLRHQSMTIDFPLDQRAERIRLLNWQGEGFASDDSRVVALDAPATDERRPSPPSGDRGVLVVPGDNVVRLFALSAERGNAPVLRAQVPVTGKAVAAFLRDGRLYALSETSLQVFTGDHGDNYRLIGKLDAFDHAQSLAWAGTDSLLVGDKNRGVVIVSLEDAAAPRIVAEQHLPAFMTKGSGGIQDLLVSGRRVFVARGTFGVQVLDLSDLPRLKTIEQIDTPGTARKLAFYDGFLLVADHGRGIQVIDTREVESRLVATIPLPAHGDSFIATDRGLLISIPGAGVMRLPLPRRLNGIWFDEEGQGSGELPADLPTGNYRLVLYDGERVAAADFALD